MASNFDEDARRVIELVEETGITKRQGVIVLIFGRRHARFAGYLNANPYNAARAMVEFSWRNIPTLDGLPGFAASGQRRQEGETAVAEHACRVLRPYCASKSLR